MFDPKAALTAIRADPRYLKNLDLGKPRPGHPEGTVRAHIAELENNLESLKPKLTEDEADRLLLLIHTHDTFKEEANPRASIREPDSHASLARAFLAEYCDDADLLTMVQLHDEPYALWRQAKSKSFYSISRFEELLATIRDWDVFLAFEIIDGCTDGKSRDPLEWLLDEVGGKVTSRFSAADIL